MAVAVGLGCYCYFAGLLLGPRLFGGIGEEMTDGYGRVRGRG